MPASVWTGYLTFGLISMPVRLFSGARSTRISFHMLHRDDLTRVKQQLYCPNDERVIERNEVVKGYEFRKGEYVVIEPDEIKKWLIQFFRRFFGAQWKRDCTPDGPKVGAVALSPRGDWRMPSDAVAASWLQEIELPHV